MGPYEWLLDKLDSEPIAAPIDINSFLFMENVDGVEVVSDDDVAPSEAAALGVYRAADDAKTDLAKGAAWIVAGVALFFAVRAVMKG